MNSTDSQQSIMYLLLAVCLGLVISLLLVLVLVKRKRAQSQQLVKHGFLPVDTQNPEERHISNMQLNGYENPTYKFFEANAQA